MNSKESSVTIPYVSDDLQVPVADFLESEVSDFFVTFHLTVR